MSGFDYDAAASRIAREFQAIGTEKNRTEPAVEKSGFGDVLQGILGETDGLQKKADAAVTDLISGKQDNPHEVMLSMAQADVSFRMMIEVRNKLVEAYQEVMRMQV